MATKLLLIFVTGLVVLAAAILLNLIASKLDIPTWYDYLKTTRGHPAGAYLWLYVAYPFLLGLTAYVCFKLLFIK